MKPVITVVVFLGLLSGLAGCATQGKPPPTISLDQSVKAQPLPEPRLAVDAGTARATAQRFGIRDRYAAFCPGAEYGPAKRWPYFAELAARVPLPVVMLGSARDREACAGVRGLDLAAADVDPS